jgi:hypothetical protein
MQTAKVPSATFFSVGGEVIVGIWQGGAPAAYCYECRVGVFADRE